MREDPFGDKKKGSNRFVRDDSLSGSQDTSDFIDGNPRRYPNLGQDDAYPDLSGHIHTREKHPKGSIPTTQELEDIMREHARQKNSKTKPRGAKYDTIKPGKKTNDPDPDNYSPDRRMDEY